MLILKLAFLNIGRNPRRSVITILAIAVGLAALIFLWGFSDGTTEQQRENVIRLFTGHLQVHAAGFEKNLSPELLIPNRVKTLSLIQSQKETVAVSERIKTEALVGTSENSRGVLLIGLDPKQEVKVTELPKHIREGSFFDDSKEKQILIGDRLAEKIRVKLKGKVVVLTQAIDGTMAGYAYRVKGIFHTGSEQVDEHTAYIQLDSARDLLTTGEETHEIVIRLRSRADIPSALNSLKSSLPKEDYEILTWDQIVPEVEQWVIWSESIIQTILITVMIVIGVGIMNTVLMSVFERTRELGVMLAIGTTPFQIVKLILLETIVLEMIGIFLGVIGGYAVVFYFSKAGISFRGVEDAFASSFMSTTVYTQVAFDHVLQSVITLIFLTTFIGLYPAWKAGRMEPVKAIYHSY